MPVTIQVHLDAAKLKALTHDVPVRIEAVLDVISGNALANAIASMAGPRTGRAYRRGAIKRYRKGPVPVGIRWGVSASGKRYQIVGYKIHRASAPGEPPAVDTGNLKNSAFRQKGKGWRVIGFSAEYAAHLEYGTVNMAPRPYLKPAIVKAGGELVQAMKDVFE